MHPSGPLSFLWGVVWRGKGGLGGRVWGFVNFFIFIFRFGSWVHGKHFCCLVIFFLCFFSHGRLFYKKKAFVRGNVKEN
jgi:hypothetical protein